MFRRKNTAEAYGLIRQVAQEQAEKRRQSELSLPGDVDPTARSGPSPPAAAPEPPSLTGKSAEPPAHGPARRRPLGAEPFLAAQPAPSRGRPGVPRPPSRGAASRRSSSELFQWLEGDAGDTVGPEEEDLAAEPSAAGSAPPRLDEPVGAGAMDMDAEAEDEPPVAHRARSSGSLVPAPEGAPPWERERALEAGNEIWAGRRGRRAVDPALVGGPASVRAADARRIDLLEAREPRLPHAGNPPLVGASGGMSVSSSAAPPGEGERGRGPPGEGPRAGKPARAAGEPAARRPAKRKSSRGPGTPREPEPEREIGLACEGSPPGSSRQGSGDAPGGAPAVPSPSISPSSSSSSPVPDPTLAGAAVPATSAASRAVARGLGWMLGSESSAWLARRVELRLSTLFMTTILGVVVVTLVLTYLRLPGEADPFFQDGGDPAASFAGAPLVQGPGPVPASSPERAPALAPVPKGSDAGAEPREGGSDIQHGGERTAGFARRLALWSPDSQSSPVSLDDPAARRPGRPPAEIRNLVQAQPRPEQAEAREEAAPTRPTGEASPPVEETLSPYVYRIQVRAKESWQGAQRILEYLALFGFRQPTIEEDPRGDRDGDGKPLYTVFVGKFSSKQAAERECGRLKLETRQTPYKNREDFFQESLVITRKR